MIPPFLPVKNWKVVPIFPTYQFIISSRMFKVVVNQDAEVTATVDTLEHKSEEDMLWPRRPQISDWTLYCIYIYIIYPHVRAEAS